MTVTSVASLRLPIGGLILLTILACGSDSTDPGFTPDFPISRTVVSRVKTTDGDSGQRVVVWEIRDAQDRLVPGAKVNFVASNSYVTPFPTATSGQDGRLTYTWRYLVEGRVHNETSTLLYCLTYTDPCTPDEDHEAEIIITDTFDP